MTQQTEKPSAPTIADYNPGEWFTAHTVDEMQAFYLSRLPAIRAAAKECGYAIGVHGSTRRDLDLIAVPWRDDCENHNDLAIAVQNAACGFVMTNYQWEEKAAGRSATCFPICRTEWHGMVSAGHVDLSVVVTLAEERSWEKTHVPHDICDMMLNAFLGIDAEREMEPRAYENSLDAMEQAGLKLLGSRWFRRVYEQTDLIALLEILEPKIGWRGKGENDTEIFYCEFCGESHADSSHIQHAAECVVPLVRSAIAKAKKAASHV